MGSMKYKKTVLKSKMEIRQIALGAEEIWKLSQNELNEL